MRAAATAPGTRPSRSRLTFSRRTGLGPKIGWGVADPDQLGIEQHVAVRGHDPPVEIEIGQDLCDEIADVS